MTKETTDDTQTTETERDGNRIDEDSPSADENSSNGIRRRTMIAATLGSPALFGLGFGVTDHFALPEVADVASNLSPVERSQAGNTVLAQMDSVDTTVGEETAQNLPMNQYHVLQASEDVFETLEREPGEQVRVTRDDDTAVFTLAAEDDEDAMDDSADAVVRASGEGKCRLAFFEDDDFEDDRRWGPLRGDETCDLADEEFEVEIDPQVPADDLDTDEAADDGELVETYVEGETDIAVIAPHGGRIQPFTDLQVEKMLEDFDDITGWMLEGFGQNTSFYRWYVPSAEMAEVSYPGLAELSEETYDTAVSFNGITGDEIYVGGTADESLRQDIVDAIEEALPHDGSPVSLGENQYSATRSETLVNRITDGESGGIWIGQPIADRRNSWDVIVEAVGSVLADE